MNGPATINDLCNRCQRWADEYYQRLTPEGRRVPTREARNMSDAMGALRQAKLDGQPIADLPPRAFRAEHLIAAQQWMIAQGLSTRVINDRINRIRRVFRWATKPPQRWVPTSVLSDLKLIDPVKRGRTAAPTHEPVKPVAWETVAATMAHADLELSTMIELLWWTGMCPSELINMRIEHLADESDVDGPLLIYRPPHHKTAHHGIKHAIAIGPNGCAVLRPWLRRCRRQAGLIWRYRSVNGFYLAIRRLNKRRKLAAWFPYQIRHAWATRMRKLAGLDVTQAAMDHQSVHTTEIYAEPDRTAARAAIRKHC